MLIFPFGIPGFLVLRRFSNFEARKLDAELSNRAARALVERVSNAASIPLALVGAAYRYSADEKENAIQTVQQGSAMLKTQVPYALAAQPVKARWLVAPKMRKKAGSQEEDLARRHQVTSWLFDELTSELAQPIRALPANVPLTIQLRVQNGHTHEQSKKLLEERWRAKLDRSMVVAPEAESPADFDSVDAWMDQLLKGEGMRATLLVAVQLHPLLAEETQPEGTSEAGTALLLIPDALAAQHKVSRIANLHRPVRGAVADVSEPLSTALRWASVSADQIKGTWQTGLDMLQTGKLREPTVKMGLAAKVIDLDQTIGHTGVAAPWLSIACATASLTDEAAEQLIVVSQDNHIDSAVLKRA